MQEPEETGPGSLPPEKHSEFAHRVMRRQARLSIGVAIVFGILLLGMPLFNLYAPKLAATQVGGFTLTWLILGVLFFPITWFLSSYFVKASNKIESECADWRKILEDES